MKYKLKLKFLVCSPEKFVKKYFLAGIIEKRKKTHVTVVRTNQGNVDVLNRLLVNAAGDWVALINNGNDLPKDAMSKMLKYSKTHPEKKIFSFGSLEDNSTEKKSMDVDDVLDLAKRMSAGLLTLIHKDVFRKIGIFDERFGDMRKLDFFSRVCFHMPEFIGFIECNIKSQTVEVRYDSEEFKILRKKISLHQEVYRGKFEKTVSIIILSFNRGRRLKQTIDTILEFTKNIKKEIIIWDNGSEDKETKDILKQLESLDEVKVILSKENLRCSGGRKEAAKLAKGDFLFFLDNDIEIKEGTIEELIIRLQESENIVASCCRIAFPNGKIQYNGGEYFEKDGFISFSLVDNGKDVDDVSSMEKQELGWIPGGATIFKKEVFEKLEHDTGFLNAYEDNDFSLGITKILKKTVVNCPTSNVIHHQFDHETIQDKGAGKYSNARHDMEALVKSWKHFVDKWNLIIKDRVLLNFIGLENASDEEIKKYLENLP